MKAVKFRVEGRVQGVGFRAFTRRTATELGLTGWVRNLADGAVEGVASGDDEDVDALLDAIASGPSAARVDGLSVDDVDDPGLPEFRIRR